MAVLWVIGGVAGSGKSSLGRRLAARRGCVFLDADDFHPPANRDKMRSGRPLDEADREPWLAALVSAVEALGGAEAVLAFPSLKAAHRQRLRRAAPRARFAWLRADLALARERLRLRPGGHFPAALAESQFQDHEPDPEALELDAALPLEALEAQALAWMEGAAGEAI